MTDWGALLEFCETDRQREIIELRNKGLSVRQVSEQIGIAGRNVQSACSRVKVAAAKQGYSPEHDMVHQVPNGFTVKGVSTYYNDQGVPTGQWVKSQSDAQALFEQALEAFKEGLIEDIKGKAERVEKPTDVKDENLLACYMVGDHHLGLLAWPEETLDDPYDVDISCRLLSNAVDNLAHISSDAHTGALINLGDFFHSNSPLKNETFAGTPLDVDGRGGRIIRAAGQLYKRLITRMLEAHNEVWIINVRGNHDPDAALWLNEMVKMYYEDEPRVRVFDNYSKFMHFVWGQNLVVLHHGDKINTQRIYEAVTRNLSKEWGETKHRVAWMGHIHHKQATKELGGMTVESWNVLGSLDAWHAGSGYGASRSMSSVILHKEFGEFSRFKVGAEQL